MYSTLTRCLIISWHDLVNIDDIDSNWKMSYLQLNVFQIYKLIGPLYTILRQRCNIMSCSVLIIRPSILSHLINLVLM